MYGRVGRQGQGQKMEIIKKKKKKHFNEQEDIEPISNSRTG